jgi:hypothetical protein
MLTHAHAHPNKKHTLIISNKGMTALPQNTMPAADPSLGPIGVPVGKLGMEDCGVTGDMGDMGEMGVTEPTTIEKSR